MEYGNIKMNRVFGVIEDKFPNTVIQSTHRSLQGYAAVHDDSNSHLFAMSNATGTMTDKTAENTQSESSSYLGEVSYSTVSNLSSIKTNLGHANDCTYMRMIALIITDYILFRLQRRQKMFPKKQLNFLLCIFLLLCSFTGCSKVKQQESPAETNTTSPISATEVASTPSPMAAEANPATPIPKWLRINERSLEVDSEAAPESRTFVRGFWYDRSDQGDYEFHMEKVKRKSGTEEIVKNVAGNYAELHYDKKTKCLTIRGSGEMFYDDFKMSLDDKVSDGDERWESIPLPIDPEKVTKIVVEPGITEVSRFAFGGFKNLKTIILPETIKTIKAFAFNGCQQLEKICIPDNTKQIGRECFFGCESLKEISIGKSLKKIRKGNFGSCKSLKNIEVSKENRYFMIQDGILYGELDKTVYFAFNNRRYCVIRKGTKKIGDFSFFFNHLESIQIPASVEKISGGAFFNCNNLQKVTFKKNSKCKTFGKYKVPLFETDWYVSPFMYCNKLINIILPDKLKHLNGGFEGCKSLHKIYIGKSLCGKKGDIPFEEFKASPHRYYIVSPENPWYSGRNGKLYNKAGTKLLDDLAAKKG